MRLYYYIKLLPVSFICVFFILAGCGKQPRDSAIKRVQINVTQEKIPSSVLIEAIDSVCISSDINYPHISSIEDYCVIDSTIYILDNAGSIFNISLHTGKVKNYANLMGRSGNECIGPKAVSFARDTVFILDFQGMKILALNQDLNVIKSLPIPVPSMDFAITSDGFLIYNMNAAEKEDQIIHINDNGEMINSFIPSRGLPEMVLSSRIFTESNDKILIMPPMGNRLYSYNPDTDSLFLEYEFSLVPERTEKSGIPDGTIQSFETERFLITDYMANQFMGNDIFDKKENKHHSGLLQTNSSYPFYPQSICDDVLYGIYEKGIGSSNQSEYIILKYKLKA